MRYLRIENRSNFMPSVELFTTLGLSTSRGNDSSIGQFGTGEKFALAQFAREGILEKCKRCIGLEVYTYQIKPEALRDDCGRSFINERIIMKKQGGKTVDLNMSVGFGEMNWQNIEMSLREIVTNSLDASEKYDGTYQTFDLSIVEENECRAKEGVIRFYIPLTQAVQAYVLKMGINFPCIMPDYDKTKTILPGDNGNCKIYRKGVMVGEFPQKSLFNYNIKNVEIDECRIVNSDVARAECARHLAAKATAEQAELYVREVMLGNKTDLWESGFDSYYFDISEVYNKNGNKAVWQEAVNKVLGNRILVSDVHQKEIVESRGHIAYCPENASHAKHLRNLNVQTVESILNFHDLQGREIVPTNENVRNTFDKVWADIERMNMTANKTKPEIKEYVQNTLAAGASEAYYFENTVFIRKDYEDDHGFKLLELMIHELGHHCTDSTDMTRSFEGWAFKIAATLMNEKFHQS